MFGNNKNKTNRFIIKSVETVPKFGQIRILVDRETGVNYLHSWVGGGSSITPLLDENGEVIVDE